MIKQWSFFNEGCRQISSASSLAPDFEGFTTNAMDSMGFM